MSIAEKYRPHYTYDDYCLWKGRWELIEGMPYAMSPAPNSRHQWIASKLSAFFIESLKDCKKCKVYQPIDWKISDYTVLQPDISIICKPFNNINFLDFAPALVVEILSPSTASKDRNEKYELYEMNGVKYYLMIDPGFKKIEIFELISNNFQPVAVNPDSFEFDIEECKAAVSFAGLFDE